MSTATANKLKQYKALRQMAYNQMAELRAFADRASKDDNSLLQFKIMYERIDSIQKEFIKNHQSVLSLAVLSDDGDIEPEEATRKEFEYIGSYVYAIYATLLENKPPFPIDQTGSSSSSVPISNAKLPKVDIPKFNGNLKQFRSFFDMYNSLVHENQTISKIEKFNYLCSFLEGPPLSLVQCTQMTADNYEIAYKALIDRYDNKRLIAFTHLQAIDNAPVITNSKNGKTLRSLVDIFTENLAALNNMGFSTENWDFLLFYIFSKHLDQDTITRYELEEKIGSSSIPTFESLKNFVLKQCNALEAIEFSSNQSVNRTFRLENSAKVKARSQNSPRTQTFFGNTGNLACPFCKSGDHLIYKCPDFNAKTALERLNIVKNNNWCTNCLSSVHNIRTCHSTSVCRTCNRKHHSLLHINNNRSQPAAGSNNSSVNNNSSPVDKIHTEQPSSSNQHSNAFFAVQFSETSPHVQDDIPGSSPFCASSDSQCGVASCSTDVILGTALVEILDSRGFYHTVRVLLDCGSQSSYISQKCVKKLGLPRYNLSLSIHGLGNMKETTSSGGTTCTLKPVGRAEPFIEVEVVILNKICSDIPNTLIKNSDFPHFSNLNLADPNFMQPLPIDMLLGADIFPYILQDGRKLSNAGMPVAINTIFGYVIMGKHESRFSNISMTTFFSTTQDSDTFELDRTMKRFWEIEEIPKSNPLSREDEICENIFNKTHFRDKTGRYIVQLPFREDFPDFDIENSRALALKRFLSLEKRLIANPEIYQQYSDIIRDYLNDDFLELVPVSSLNKINCYYLPHHCVTKGDKIRIVFDASFKVQGFSLNDKLLTGPKLQRDIFSILLNFRIHSVAFTCDIKSMFTQILVSKKHIDFQRMLWRFSPDEEIKDFRLKRVTFGISSSPYLANRVILQLVADEGARFPLASEVLKRDIFVDDCVTSCKTIEEALELRKQLIELLNLGGFQLRKFTSNNSNFLSGLPETHLLYKPVDFDTESNSIKILGLHWIPNSDAFAYRIEPQNRKITKRTILSEIARCFDPLGFLSPLTLFTKLLIQILWSLGLDWDDEPPPFIIERWLRYQKELPLLSEFSLPRRFILDDFSSCELHGFCDASQKGTACVIYFRILQNDDSYRTFFVTSKSKVAPLSVISVPRLELVSAVMLADLMHMVLQTLSGQISFSKIFAWSDSTVVLTWIKNPPFRWKPFIANRVSRIQEKICSSFWHHVDTNHNPADCATRGLSPAELLNCTLWWAGPPFLCQHEELWPSTKFVEPKFNDELFSEERKLTLAVFADDNRLDYLINSFSSLPKIQRILAYAYRFILGCKGNKIKSSSFTMLELNRALFILIKHVQELHFSDEITNLRNKKLTSKPFRKLNAFLDTQGILRVGGRLHKSELSYDQRHPAILPRKSRLTTLLIEHYHTIYMHPGAQTLQFLLNQHFWLLSAKRSIRSVISNCKNCWRLSPRSYQPPMGNLPKQRVSQLKSFSCVAVDCAGPFLTTLGKRRGLKPTKSYVCVFVCFATKAIHLELVSELSSEAFLCALRRFISRRGRCDMIWSDNGTNFIGAARQISDMLKNAAESEMLEWHFNPPSAPHFSGLVEAGVKSVKTHLRRVIGDQIFTFEEFYTILVQIEALLNSRPLCPLSSDPNDLSVLTPGHFLTLQPLSILPDNDLSHLKLSHLNRWQMLQRLHQDFWSRWHREYLHTLQQRGKWLECPSRSAKIGTMVLIKENNSPPSKWHLGRITQLHPGADGVSRVATVHTSQGDIRRPVVKLCPLPLAEESG